MGPGGGGGELVGEVRGDLYAASAVRKARTVNTRRTVAVGTLAPLLVAIDRQPPSRQNSTRSSVQPTTEWLANTFGDLGVSQR